jgi:hypothetical protein
MIRVTVTWDGHDTTVTVDPPDTHDSVLLALLVGAAKQPQHRLDLAKAEGIANYEMHRIARDWRFKR